MPVDATAKVVMAFGTRAESLSIAPDQKSYLIPMECRFQNQIKKGENERTENEIFVLAFPAMDFT